MTIDHFRKSLILVLRPEYHLGDSGVFSLDLLLLLMADGKFTLAVASEQA
jgi:hypothetical protein